MKQSQLGNIHQTCKAGYIIHLHGSFYAIQHSHQKNCNFSQHTIFVNIILCNVILLNTILVIQKFTCLKLFYRTVCPFHFTDIKLSNYEQLPQNFEEYGQTI